VHHSTLLKQQLVIAEAAGKNVLAGQREKRQEKKANNGFDFSTLRWNLLTRSAEIPQLSEVLRIVMWFTCSKSLPNNRKDNNKRKKGSQVPFTSQRKAIKFHRLVVEPSVNVAEKITKDSRQFLFMCLLQHLQERSNKVWILWCAKVQP